MNGVPKHASRPQAKQIHHPYPRHFLPTRFDYFQNLLDGSIVSYEVEGRLLVMALRIRVSTVAMDYFYCPKTSAPATAQLISPLAISDFNSAAMRAHAIACCRGGTLAHFPEITVMYVQWITARFVIYVGSGRFGPLMCGG